MENRRDARGGQDAARDEAGSQARALERVDTGVPGGGGNQPEEAGYSGCGGFIVWSVASGMGNRGSYEAT